MSKQRNITNEQILYFLINLREQEAKNDLNKYIVINKELCKEIGLFQYKVKDTGEERADYLFLINETQDGENVDIIYDKQGRFIAYQKENEELKCAKDIEINEEMLKRQIKLAKNRELQENNDNNNGSSRAGEGRDLASKEHEENKKNDMQEEKNPNQNEEQDIEEQEKDKEEKLPNLKDKVGIYNDMMIRLDEIINGHYLWEILQLEYKLPGKLPDGISAKEFRTGFLTIVDSDELTAIDGKERQAKDRLAIRTLGGDLIELDETILKEKPAVSRQEQFEAERNRLRYADGKEVEKPDADINTDLTRIALYEIPGVSDSFNVAENWYLAIDKNANHMRNPAERAPGGNNKEISFVQASRNESYYEREYNPMHTLEYKLEPLNESCLQTKKEYEQQQELKDKNPNEALIERAEHSNELVDKCFEKYKNLRRIL